MVYLAGKIAIFAVLAILVFSQANKTVPSPDPSWDEYSIIACCP